jgi:hypothetical protein
MYADAFSAVVSPSKSLKAATGPSVLYLKSFDEKIERFLQM